MVEKVKYIWMDGKFVNWDKAQIHILTHSFHYGLAAFEGIRSYKTVDGRSAVFRLKDHVQRLYDSTKIMGFEVPYEFDYICEVCKQLLVKNGLDEGYLRPIVYLGYGAMGVYPANNPIRVAIASWRWGKYLGDDALTKGVRIRVSSYQRYHPNSEMTKGKLTGGYITSVLAKVEAIKLGYHEALFMDADGFVAEGSGENIFIIKRGIIKTTPLTSILPGITRDCVTVLAKDLGYEVVEQRFTRDEVYIADEAFFTGTAAEITPIAELDDRKIGKGIPGPITMKLQKIYFDVVHGKIEKYKGWLDYYSIKKEPKKPTKRTAKVAR
jgi:branched-chain amino acid aminotransferase